MIYALKVLGAGILLAIIQSTFLNAIAIGGVRPDLLVLGVLLVIRRNDFGKLLTLAFVFGLTRDFFSAGAIGMNAFALTLVAYLLWLAADFVLAEGWLGQAFLTFVAAVGYAAFIVMLKVLLGYELGSAIGNLKIILGTSLYTAAAAPLLFLVLSKPQALPYLRLKLKHIAEHETIPEIKT